MVHHPQPWADGPDIWLTYTRKRVVKAPKTAVHGDLDSEALTGPSLATFPTAPCRGPETLEMTNRVEKSSKILVWKCAWCWPTRPRDYPLRDRARHRRQRVANCGSGKGFGVLNWLVSIRVVETIATKNYMAGYPTPSASRSSCLKFLGSQVYNEAKSMLTMGLGKDIVPQATPSC